MATKRTTAGSSKKICTKTTDEDATNEMESIFSDDEDFTLSSNEDISRITKYETTTEIIGYVDSVDSPRSVGKKGNNIFKFFVNNGAGHRIQVIAWNNEIERIQPHIKLDHIVHIDGAMAVPSNEKFRVGTIDFELTIRSNTMINNYGPRKVIDREPSELPVTLLKDAFSTTEFTKTQGYIKTNFLWVEKYQNDMEEFGSGSITDGEFKLEVRITNFPADSYHDFDKGEKIEILGRMQTNTQPIHMVVTSMEDSTKLNEPKMSLKKLLRGTAIPDPKENLTKVEDTAQTTSKMKKRKYN